METFLYYAGKALFQMCLRKYRKKQRKQREYILEITARHQEALAEKNARITALEEENKILASNVARIVEEYNEMKKKLRKMEESFVHFTPDVPEAIEMLRQREMKAREEEEEMSCQMCLRKYREKQRKQREYILEITARHQEALAEKNARITTLEEENKILASNVARIVEENNEMKKKLRKMEESFVHFTPDVPEAIEMLRQ